jgi:hypothetical protein
VATNIRNNRKIVGCVIFYPVRVLSKEGIWDFPCVPISLKGKGSMNTSPRQRRIVAGVFFPFGRCRIRGSRRLIYFQKFLLFSSLSKMTSVFIVINHSSKQSKLGSTFKLIIFSFNLRAFVGIIFCELFSSPYNDRLRGTTGER